ncbi:MAG: hypothetical protein HQL88_02925 [Magnetococcales bacterium]|nr:hypothetical protein [Magnetococcales bacterium]
MKRLLLLATLFAWLAPGAVWADKEGSGKERGAGPEANFAKVKAKKVEDLKALLACVEQAQSGEAMKNCREQLSKKNKMQEREHRLQKIQEQKRKLEEQERRLQSGEGR